MASINKIVLNGTEYTIGGDAIPYSVKQAMATLYANSLFNDDDSADAYNEFVSWVDDSPVTSISATYTQSGKVYSVDSLDSLKSDLVVTASYADGTSSVVNDYTLSGTLEVGESTITVSYYGKTDTFTVTVESGILCQLLNTTFTGDTSEKVVFSVYPFATDSDWTLVLDYETGGVYTSLAYVFTCAETSGDYWGTRLETTNATKYRILSYGQTYDLTAFTPLNNGYIKAILRHTAGETNVEWTFTNGTTTKTYTLGTKIKSLEKSIAVGGGGFKGVINSFTWYTYRFTDDQKNAFLGVTE